MKKKEIIFIDEDTLTKEELEVAEDVETEEPGRVPE